MLRSYFKTAFRFLLRNKTYSFINIFGLAAGTLCCLYILLYVEDQYSYDRHQAGGANIYRIDHHLTARGEVVNLANTAAPVAAAMKRDFPEVEEYTRVVPFPGVEKHLLQYKDKSIWEKNAFLVDPTFFDLFTYRAVSGDLRTALVAPYTVVLLAETAEKLFGSGTAVGRTITIDNTEGKHDYQVTAVVGSLGKSHLEGNIFISMPSGRMGEFMLHSTVWGNNAFIGSYLRLRPGTDVAALEKKFPAFVEKYAGQELRGWGGKEQLYLQPLRSIHTTTGFDNPGIGKPVNPSFLGILLLIAGLIQLVACINFMNLSTARAAQRAKEVGVRKVIGAGRGDLIRQFLSESMLLALAGVVIALPLLYLLLPYLNGVTGSDIRAHSLASMRVVWLMAGLIFVTGLIAGSYPAFYLSAFQAVKVIKGNFTSRVSAAGVRRSLVVFQFVLSIVLISGIIVIYDQLQYIKNKDLGFDKDQRLVFSFSSTGAFERIGPFMDDLRKLPEVAGVSNASSYLSNPAMFSTAFMLAGQPLTESSQADYLIADEHFASVNGIRLVSGRDLMTGDSAKVLVNETFARRLGLTPSRAVGVRLHDNDGRQFDIVGVMKDFNYWSLHSNVNSFLVRINDRHAGFWPHVVVHTNTAGYGQLLSRVAALWRKDVPGVPFEYSFLDQQVQKQYEADIAVSRIINAFTGMAILISALGLFALAAYSAEQRSKEIGIRKVMGASVPGIVRLLSADFLRLVGMAMLIAIPVAWWAMHRWLEGFAYHIGLSWWMFALAGLAAGVVALLTVTFQAVRAAMANPVRSLRAE